MFDHYREHRRVFRMSVGTLVFSWIALILCLAMVSLGSTDIAEDGSIVLIVLGALGAVVITAIGIKPRLVATAEHLTVSNPFVAHVVPWETIKQIDGEDRVAIELRSGSTMIAWAIQRTNLWVMLGRRGRPQHVAAILQGHLEGVADHETAQTQLETRRLVIPWTVLVVIAVVGVMSSPSLLG